MKKLILTLLLFPLSTLADGIATGKIKGYAINTNSVFVSVDGYIDNKPGCNTTNRFFFNLSEAYSDTMLSTIYAAYHTGKELILTGTGDCDNGNSEMLRKICTLDVPC